MGKIVESNLPCLDCDSSDARQLYEDGTSFCFSCRSWFKADAAEGVEIAHSDKPRKKRDPKAEIEEILTFGHRGFIERDVKKVICEYYGVRVSYNSSGEIDAHYYPYASNTAFKVRKLPKDFTWVGKSTKLFGQDKFSGGGKRLIIAEGEIDALSLAQASYEKYKTFYPVVGLSSASIAEKSLLENRDWVRSFDEVVLCLDNDEAGREATKLAIRIIGVDKVKIATLPEKDPNEVLLKHGWDALLKCVFNAAPYVPAGIIKKEALWSLLEAYNDVESVPFPACLDGLNAKIKGMRGGEITLFISGTGSGKSTVLREIMLQVLETTDSKIGIVSLEESPAESARKLSGMKIHKNPANEEIPIGELKVGFDAVFGDDRVELLDHQGSMNDSGIIDKLEYMCLAGCKFLFIDHITILVSEGVDNLTGNEAQDKIMNELLRLVKRYPSVWIGLVSHLRKVQNGKKSFEEGRLPTMDDIRGSGSIKQVSFDIVAFARNLTAKDVKRQNSIRMRVLKARYTGLTGDVLGACYNSETGRLSMSDSFLDEDEEDFTAL